MIYGLATPQGMLSLTNVASTFPGATQTETTFGTARLADIDVITDNSFDLQLNTTPVTLPAPAGEQNSVRDFDADGDEALFRFDRGLDLNANAGVDHVSPGSVSYAFEEFTDTRTPGYIDDGNGNNIGTGIGTYVQTIDATQLSEGRHYVTVRAFRHRDDGGPAVYQDFKRTIYIDRLPPDSQFESFEPFATAPNDTQNRDLVFRNPDRTADNMHFFLDLPATTTDAQIMQVVQQGVGDAGDYDRDSFIFGYFGVGTGNHVATVVTFEPTGNSSIVRYPGLFTQTSVGAGFGDTDYDGTLEVSDLAGSGDGSVEDILFSQNDKFSAAFDVTGDGLGDNRDLFALEDELVPNGASGQVLVAYHELLLRRGDLNESGTTDEDDFESLYNSFGSAAWLTDLNVDGTATIDDVATMIVNIYRTVPGDFDLNGLVDSTDVAIHQASNGTMSGARYTQGDADLDGDVDNDDLMIVQDAIGFVGAVAVAAADYNGDAVINAGDYTMWRDSLGSMTTLNADGDGDGVIALGDYDYWRMLAGRSLFDFSTSGTATGQAVPEPSGATLLLTLTCIFPICTQRDRSGRHS